MPIDFGLWLHEMVTKTFHAANLVEGGVNALFDKTLFISAIQLVVCIHRHPVLSTPKRLSMSVSVTQIIHVCETENCSKAQIN